MHTLTETSACVAATVRRLREERGWSIDEFRDRCQEQTDSNWITYSGAKERMRAAGIGSVSVDELVVFAEALGVSPHDLLTGEGAR